MKPLHFKCLNSVYPSSGGIGRFHLDTSQLRWDVELPVYHPPDFTADFVRNAVWADPDISDPNFRPKFNELDGAVNRVSYDGPYDIEKSSGRPLNPRGRTGIRGRGVLGKWGPNHAADPIVTRWKRAANGSKLPHKSSNKDILQFVAIRRRDTGDWAIPGGMVDPGEQISQTLKREFGEEAMNSIEMSPQELEGLHRTLAEFFQHGTEVYRGYVDDPRNTDNAWMETVAYNFHDETGKSVGRFNLHAGDDAVGVMWQDISKDLSLYANHVEFIRTVVSKLQAHW